MNRADIVTCINDYNPVPYPCKVILPLSGFPRAIARSKGRRASIIRFVLEDSLRGHSHRFFSLLLRKFDVFLAIKMANDIEAVAMLTKSTLMNCQQGVTVRKWSRLRSLLSSDQPINLERGCCGVKPIQAGKGARKFAKEYHKRPNT